MVAKLMESFQLSLNGDVGDNIKGGSNKKIVWDVLKDIERIEGVNFVFNVKAIEENIFTDVRDGKIYKKIKIGNQTWMSENLKYITSKSSWCYDNKTENCDKYGRLYDWKTANRACPAGWHLPSNNEWQALIDYLGGGNDVTGGKLKSTSEWNDANTFGITNSSGFSALPGGYRSNGGGVFFNLGNNSFWWSATESGGAYAWGCELKYTYVHMLNGYDKLFGLSVRCLKDY